MREQGFGKLITWPIFHGAHPFPTCTVMAAFLVIVWYMPMKATLLSRS